MSENTDQIVGKIICDVCKLPLIPPGFMVRVWVLDEFLLRFHNYCAEGLKEALEIVLETNKCPDYLGNPRIRKEGCPLHPDDINADMTDAQYERQLKAYNDSVNKRNE